MALPDGRLDVDAPEELLTTALVEALRGCKAELLRLLAGGSGDPPDPRDGDMVIDPQDLTEGGGAMVDDDRQDHARPLVATRQEHAHGAHKSAAVPIQWPAAAADFCLRLAPGDLPPVPFRLNAWTTVSVTGRFLRSLQADIERGPSGPRAFYGALQNELIKLQQFAHNGQKGR